MSRTRIGEIRPSQLLWSYGPGALIDLPNMSVVTMSSEHWEEPRCRAIHEARLLANVRRVLGPQVESLRMPPINEEEVKDSTSAEALIGVPVKPFPRWLRCVKCGLLSPVDAGLFELKDRFRIERARYVHKGCKGSDGTKRATDADAVPARFLIACKSGHLDDFPWHWFVHRGPSDCQGWLRFYENGASLQTENLWVKCDECEASRNMAHAFGKASLENLPGCRGRHPHLTRFEECDQEARTVLLGATNGWFPATLSVLAIPPKSSTPLSQLIQDGWTFFEDAEDEPEVKTIVKTLKKSGQLPGIEAYEIGEIWASIQSHQGGGDEVHDRDIKTPEWEVLTADEPPNDYPSFKSKVVSAPNQFRDEIKRVVLLERLKEVNALIGFTRIESPEEEAGEDSVKRAPLTSRAPEWVPATEVHGEGVFIEFNLNHLEEWHGREAVDGLDKKLRAAHRGWRRKRKLDPEVGYPGIRYAMLHTLAHALIREMALECGYNAASIRERVYADVEGDQNQAGVLIYTAAADSDGTLGGLVELGKPENLERLLTQALDRAEVCSSDPLCAEHDPTKDQSLHGASCHACSFVAETSCEAGNRYLDRALLMPTLETRGAAFFWWEG
ncbi:DUF1998 domain-containing protein [Halomonas elongata]|uniref:DUF1998 domain-containing protein n=1 Tax=Halomonas elongata TaxID=2746 RepID=UPI00255A8508|nr:DUF1998 domain-containing protein [Halomonas elongata]MDL4861185.1 DUF1998 domain-containing protein [Halomonas elongata]